MKYPLSQVGVAIASLSLSLMIPPAAQAYTFGQAEVDQSKFIAIAAPFAEGKHYKSLGHIYFTHDPASSMDSLAEAPTDAMSSWEGKDIPPAATDSLPELKPSSTYDSKSDLESAAPTPSAKARLQEWNALTNLITSPIEIPESKPRPSLPSDSAVPTDRTAEPQPEGKTNLPKDTDLPKLEGEKPSPKSLSSPKSRSQSQPVVATQPRHSVKLASKASLSTGAFSHLI